MQLNVVLLAVTAFLISSTTAKSTKCNEAEYCVNNGEIVCGKDIARPVHGLYICKDKCWVRLQYCQDGCAKDPRAHCN
ncbi:hypothetical protein DE146DRAFT_755242 [Phaeosphaeria sp. MPI-PUGE-AT-0046c]|nr:hypothetical protein DE146DRAFT_755242 [Phaeosphaeria sp. MPI-PUGE-AT-0046c]